MPCYRPIKGYRSARVSSDTGKRAVVFNARDGFVDMPVDLPCGQCVGCRLERSRQWAIRCSHEASLYDSNCFITLTYNNESLPSDGSLDVKHFQDFMKRLRFRFGSGIRFFHCGEYGEKFSRPHYHACLFNFDFPDKKLFKEERGNRLFISEALSELWPFGFSIIGDVTFESAAYVARYIMKKVNNKDAHVDADGKYWPSAEDHYSGRKPEYTTMSRRPGIGKNWFEKYTSDVYPSDFVIVRGKKMKPPKYYDRQFELAYPSDFRKVVRKRINLAQFRQIGEPYWRLADIEKCRELSLPLLKRGYENEIKDVLCVR